MTCRRDAPPEQAASKLRGHNRGWITVVALHEGYPGHHLQYVRASRNPDVVRRLYGSEVFGEGWGLYVEELMYREGFYPDSLTRLVQLQARLWRVVLVTKRSAKPLARSRARASCAPGSRRAPS